MSGECSRTYTDRGLVTRCLSFVGRLFRGSSRGAGYVEYLLIGAMCALGLIFMFQRFRAIQNVKIRNQAKTVVALDSPNPQDVIAALGGYEDYTENLTCTGDICMVPGQCFAAGTLVDTELGDRPIESIQVGDRVWSRNETTLAVALHSVTRKFVTHDRYVIDLTLGQDPLRSETVTVTPNHPFWVDGQGWTRAEALSTSSAWSPEGPLSAVATIGYSQPITVYNLEVAGDHTYFVGHLHALVHNAGKCPGAPTYTDAQWGYIGEARGAQQAARDGLSDLFQGYPWPEYNPIRRSQTDGMALTGFDDVRVDGNGNVYIVEYKGNNATLDSGPPPQMSKAWVDQKLSEIQNWLSQDKNKTDITYDRVQAAYTALVNAEQEGKLFGRVYSTPADPTSPDGIGATVPKQGFDYGKPGSGKVNCGNAGAPSPPCP
ncbi:MAG TPA: polymorphic toxin-type HINT domain-containing protein [Polyangiaceae bacterium]|nr:polymorphic toxin-type HINT domain-containing protein [Polyangiaceae bacterium]